MGRASTSYYVCVVKDSDGAITFEAVRSSQLDERMDELKKDYVEAYRAWLIAVKEAKKAGDDFDDPKPKRPALKKLSSKIKGQDKAQSLASLYQEKYEAKLRKKQDKELEKFEDDEPAKLSKKS